ncbi:MAG: hypothetical protein FD164_657 [Nitrospirae bacterium]|nr:MAG: hypothetical protein FD164_657 [Nitrospirota bacterium]
MRESFGQLFSEAASMQEPECPMQIQQPFFYFLTLSGIEKTFNLLCRGLLKGFSLFNHFVQARK